MKRIKYVLFFLLLAMLSVFFLRGDERQNGNPRLWLGGLELTEGGCFEIGGGTAEYLPAEQLLTLRSVNVSDCFRRAALYCDGDLTLCLDGNSGFYGDKNGITVLGNLSVGGNGTLYAEGKHSGAAVRGSLMLFDSGAITFRSPGKPLRWGAFHASTLNRSEQTEELLRVYAPCYVTLLDASDDIAGHPLTGELCFDRFPVRCGEPIPEPEAPFREGYRFEGWYTDNALTEKYDFSQNCADSLSLYAAWNQLITVHYDSWGGSVLPDTVTTWGQAAAEPPVPEREGYRFMGWYRDPELKSPYRPHEPHTENRVVYAAWEKIAYAVGSGVDVSRYQGEIDWTKLAAETDFAFIRIGFRGYGENGSLNADENFEQNLRSASEAGVPTGVYFFSQAVSEAEALEEADFVLTLLDGCELALPVVIDYELASAPDGSLLGRLYDAQLSGTEHGRICAAFCREIEAHGYTAAVYAGIQMLESGAAEVLEREAYPVWLANWTVQTRYNGDYFCWQYSSVGRCAGISGEVDLNDYYVPMPGEALTVSLNRRDGSVSWERIPAVRGYILYRQMPDETEFHELVRLNGAANTSYTDKDYRDGCRYAVKAYVTLGRTNYLLG